VKQSGVNVDHRADRLARRHHRTGDYDIVVFAWVQSPFPFNGAQQTWLSTSGSQLRQVQQPAGRPAVNERPSSTDAAAATDQLNQADDDPLGTRTTLPLYQKPTFVALQDNIANVRNNSSLDVRRTTSPSGVCGRLIGTPGSGSSRRGLSGARIAST
jgi:peptide/nickel transport system substrate-binding protein